MKPIILPVTEVNSSDFTLVEWKEIDGAAVRKGQVLAVGETAKGIFDLVAEADGILGIDIPVGGRGEMQKPVGFIFESDNERLIWSDQKKIQATRQSHSLSGITAKAERLARMHGLDLGKLVSKGGLVTEKMVSDIIQSNECREENKIKISPIIAPGGVRRILLIGGGLGATQVLDILREDEKQFAVGIIDDTRDLWGNQLHGLPVLGGGNHLKQLFDGSAFDAAIVTISTSIEARRRFRNICSDYGIPMANAIDPSSRIASNVKIGTGNVICAFCFIGSYAEIGDNNFFSAYNSFDHHCRIGSDNSTGPGCICSGSVKIGNSVRMGTGIFIQPKIKIGDESQIASGAVITNHVPVRHAVKTKVITTQVVSIK